MAMAAAVAMMVEAIAGEDRDGDRVPGARLELGSASRPKKTSSYQRKEKPPQRVIELRIVEAVDHDDQERRVEQDQTKDGHPARKPG